MNRILAVGLAAVLLPILAQPVYAQLPPVNLLGDKPAPSEEQVKRQQEIDKAYKDTIKDIKPQAKRDPWGSVRRADDKPAKTAPKH